MALHSYQRRRRLALALLILAAFVALSVVGSSLSEAVHEYVEAAGLGLIALGILGRMWCTLYIGGRKAAEIVEAGPYSVTRNPLYLFSTVAAAGVGAQSGSLVLGLVFALACAAAFQVVIRREERFLSEAFGEPYRAYLLRVPRFLPRLSGFRDATGLSVRPDRLYATLLDGLVFFAAIPVFESIEHLQDAGILPILVRLP